MTQKRVRSRNVLSRVFAAMLLGYWIATSHPAIGQDLEKSQIGDSDERANQDNAATDHTREREGKPEIAVDVSANEVLGVKIRPEETQSQTEGEPDDDNPWLFMGDGLAQWIMTALSAAAFGVSVFGAVLLFKTLRATREIGEQQVRCYVLIEKASYDPHLMEGFEGQKFIGGIKATLNNSGTTPAVNVAYYAEAFLSSWLAMSEPVKPIEPTYIVALNNLSGNTSEQVNIVPFRLAIIESEFLEGISNFTNHTPLGQRPIIGIRGAIYYDDVFGKSFRSDFAFFLEEGFQEGPVAAMTGTCSGRAFRPTERPKRSEITI